MATRKRKLSPRQVQAQIDKVEKKQLALDKRVERIELKHQKRLDAELKPFNRQLDKLDKERHKLMPKLVKAAAESDC